MIFHRTSLYLPTLPIVFLIQPVFLKSLFRSSRRLITTDQRTSRRRLLESVYGTYQGLAKDSPEYHALARSGKVWENYFKPQRSEPYLEAQSNLRQALERLDKQKSVISTNTMKPATRASGKDYALQSVALEGNPLQNNDSTIIEAGLEKQLFSTTKEFARLHPHELANLILPSPTALLPDSPSTQVAELRNHIVISRYLTEMNLTHPGTPMLSLADIQHLSRAMLTGTDAENLFKYGWGTRLSLGDFRATPITVRSNPMRIFPYPFEIHSCLERFIMWRDHSSILHPLIFATHLFVYFCHIHPFPDGNGRLGRALMADYLVRKGYLPVVFVDIDRMEYVRMVSDAQDGRPEELCRAVVVAEMEMLSKASP